MKRTPTLPVFETPNVVRKRSRKKTTVKNCVRHSCPGRDHRGLWQPRRGGQVVCDSERSKSKNQRNEIALRAFD